MMPIGEEFGHFHKRIKLMTRIMAEIDAHILFYFHFPVRKAKVNCSPMENWKKNVE